MVVIGVEVGVGGALTVRHVHASAKAAENRARLGFRIMIIAGPRRHGQDVGYDVEIERAKYGCLVITALNVLAKSGVVAAYARLVDGRARRGGEVRQAGRAAGQGRGQIGGVTGRNSLIVEVHVVIQLELFQETANDEAEPPSVGRVYAQFVGQVGVFDGILPVGYRRIAGRLATTKTIGAASALIIDAVRRAGVIGIVHLLRDVADHIAAGIDDLEAVDLAVHRPGGVLELILVVGGREGGDLQ